MYSSLSAATANTLTISGYVASADVGFPIKSTRQPDEIRLNVLRYKPI
jgi:hypothetical protein